MRYCESCRVHVAGEQRYCPLCHGQLQGDPSPAPFPYIQPAYKRYGVLFRSALFLSIVVVIVCFAVNWLFQQQIWWAWLVAAGVLTMWVGLFTAIRKRSNFYKNIVWQVVLLSGFSVLWDWMIGWRSWSVSYVIPALCVLAIAMTVLAAWIEGKRIQDYLNYFLLDILFGFVPLVLLLFGLPRTAYPSVICTCVSLLALAAMVVFKWSALQEEFQKRMHL